MSVNIVESEGGGVRIVLPDVLTIAEVADAYDSLKSSALSSASRLVIDAEKTLQVDTAGLQLICALVLNANREGIPVDWLAGKSVRAAATAAGLTSALALEAGQ